MKRWLFSGVVLALVAWVWTPQAQANCEVSTTAQTFNNGSMMGAMNCDTAGNQRVIIGAPGGVSGTATASAPTLSEGSTGYFSWDLSGNLRTTLGTLLSGEDQTNNLMMTGAGVTRITTMGPVAAPATTSSVTTVPSGPKTFMAYMGGASESKAASLTIYGNWQNSTTGGVAVCTISIAAVTQTHIEDVCPTTSVAYTYYYYTTEAGAIGYTSASAASLYVYAMY